MRKNYIERMIAASGPNGQHPLVLFSGGMDSTMLLQELLQSMHVYTFYVEANQHPHKVTREREARDNLRRMFYDRYDYGIQDDFEFELNEVFVQTNNYAMVQPISWLTAALIKFDPSRHSGVAIGYLLGDQAPAFRREMEDFWRSGWALLRGMQEPAPPLWFPLLDHGYTKYEVLKRLSHDLMSNTWVCENPHKYDNQIVECKHCKPCQLLRATLDDWRDHHTEEHPYRTLLSVHAGQLKFDFVEEDDNDCDLKAAA
jgi:hypothetical protein